MNMSKWRLSFYSFCLVALGLASNALNTIPAKRSFASRAIASDVKVAIDRAAEEEILIVTPKGIIYKRTRYVESIRMQISDNRELIAKIKAKDIELKKKAKEIEILKGQRDVAASIIALALKDLKSLDQDRKRLQGELVAVQRRHEQEKSMLNADITSLKGELANSQSANENERKLKEEALTKLEQAQIDFNGLKGELEQTSGELIIAEDTIAALELKVNALTDDLAAKEEVIAQKDAQLTEKETKLAEQDSKLQEQEVRITEQSANLADLRIAECEQQKQLRELKEQVETFESEKSEMEEVLAVLKKEKEETKKKRLEERKQIEALMGQFTMFATLATQQPQPMMPQVLHNPLTNSSMVDWNQYMMLAMMGNMSRTSGMNPFDFNGGNSQVNSYYYLPKESTDAYLYNSALNPTGTSWGQIGPDNYFGNQGGGFDFSQQMGMSRSLNPSLGRGPAQFQF